MKKISTLLFIVIALSASAQRTLVHYWNFNQSDTSLWHTPTSSKVAGARLDYFGAYADYVTDGTDTTNSRDESGPAAGFAVRLRSPYGAFIMSLPTTGYQGIVVKYGLFKSSSGSSFNTVTYTTDGVKWDSVGLKITEGTSPTTTGIGTYAVVATASPLDLITLDFSNIPGVENNPKFQIQINYDPNVAGNNRYDNISLDGTPTALALSLQSFTGSITNNQTNLNWNTVNEVNAKSFTIEASTDRINFSTLGSVSAKNIAGLNNYSFQTAAPTTTTYYRLKITDKVGTVSYSSVVVLNNASSIKLSVFPNPAQNVLNVSVVNAKNETALVQVVTALGKVVKQQNVQLVAGTNSISLAIDNLAKGSYTVVIKGDATQQKQFIKN